jgi:predicted house-cleaning noncanonical NTP pyrophosphatase (MazG superfamily)
MSIKEYKKLIRDKIPEYFAAPNKTFNTRVLTDEEFKIALRQKLMEESEETLMADSKEKLIDEISDLLEVVTYIKQAENIIDQEIENHQTQKRNERGAFDQKLFLESVEEE